MSGIRIVSAIAVVVMSAVIIYGFASGSFSEEGSRILGLAWGKVTLVDLYVGLALFGTWVAVRERTWPRIGLWWGLLIVLGNLAAAVYVALASWRSQSVDELMSGESL